MTPNNNSFDVLTSLRGIAAWWVVLYHVQRYVDYSWLGTFIAKGHMAVDFFFVLSGYVITHAYSKKLAAPTASKITHFYLKRVSRIYPMHLLVLALYLLLPLAYALGDRSLPSGSKYSLDYFLASLVLIQNWGFTDTLAWNVPAWSISTEMAAYLLFPLIALVLPSLRSITLTLGLIGTLAVALAMIFASSGYQAVDDNIPRMGLARCILEFSMGTLSYRLLLLSKPLRKATACLLTGCGFVVFLAPVFYEPKPYTIYTMPLAITASLYGILNLRLSSHSIMLKKPLRYLGDASYATYIVHYWTLDMLKIATPSYESMSYLWLSLYIVFLLAITYISHEWIEGRLRQLLNARIDRWLGR